MQQQVEPKSGLGQLNPLGRAPRVRLGAVAAVALAAAFVVWLVVSTGGSATKASSSSTAGAAIPEAAGTGPLAASFQDLKSFAAAVGHPIYWAGPKHGNTYELTQTRGGAVYVRYLPPGVRVGVNEPFLTVATYPYPKAFVAVAALAKSQGGGIKLDHGGIALVDKAYPKSVHLAYPASKYQVEVFSPSPARSRQIVVSRQVASIR